MPFSSLALQWETYFAAFDSNISPKVRSKCLIEACTLGTADIHSVYTRELLIELGAQSQMISIRMIQLLIISICVKMSSSYKVGQVIGKNIKKQGVPRRCFVVHLYFLTPMTTQRLQPEPAVTCSEDRPEEKRSSDYQSRMLAASW